MSSYVLSFFLLALAARAVGQVTFESIPTASRAITGDGQGNLCIMSPSGDQISHWTPSSVTSLLVEREITGRLVQPRLDLQKFGDPQAFTCNGKNLFFHVFPDANDWGGSVGAFAALYRKLPGQVAQKLLLPRDMTRVGKQLTTGLYLKSTNDGTNSALAMVYVFNRFVSGNNASLLPAVLRFGPSGEHVVKAYLPDETSPLSLQMGCESARDYWGGVVYGNPPKSDIGRMRNALQTLAAGVTSLGYGIDCSPQGALMGFIEGTEAKLRFGVDGTDTINTWFKGTNFAGHPIGKVSELKALGDSHGAFLMETVQGVKLFIVSKTGGVQVATAPGAPTQLAVSKDTLFVLLADQRVYEVKYLPPTPKSTRRSPDRDEGRRGGHRNR